MIPERRPITQKPIFPVSGTVGIFRVSYEFTIFKSIPVFHWLLHVEWNIHRETKDRSRLNRSFHFVNLKLILRDKFDYTFIRLNAKHKYIIEIGNFHLQDRLFQRVLHWIFYVFNNIRIQSIYLNNCLWLVLTLKRCDKAHRRIRSKLLRFEHSMVYKIQIFEHRCTKLNY